MKVRKLSAVTVTRQCKSRARELLDAGHNRLWLSLAICLWIVTAGAVYLLGGGLLYAADASIFTDQPSTLAMGLVLLSYALMLLLALVLLVPMAGGIWLLARYVYEGKTLVAADLLAAFDSPKQYLHCMGVGLHGLACPLMIVAVAALGCIAAPSAAAQATSEMGAIYVLSWLAGTGAFLLGIALTLLMLCICRAAHLTSAYLARGMRWHEAKFRTKELLVKRGNGSLYYLLSFAGHVALAVVTVGVSAVVDGIPHALLCHQFACDHLKTQRK